MDETINQTAVEEKNALEERQRKLVSDKKEAETRASAEAEKARQALEEKDKAVKERDFYSSFSDSIAKYPSAPEYKDKIKEKVMAGYSVEDATISVLHSENKLVAQAPRVDNVTGGSAPNQITQQTTKTVQEMSGSEKWAALKEAQQKGDISMR